MVIELIVLYLSCHCLQVGRKVTLSIKLLEEQDKALALERYGRENSGAQLPFKTLKEDLEKKNKK